MFTVGDIVTFKGIKEGDGWEKHFEPCAGLIVSQVSVDDKGVKGHTRLYTVDGTGRVMFDADQCMFEPASRPSV